ncbi:MAG: class I SAM-dependent methyltransferase [Spirochaetales bacterium]|nr:class I SAM-dependent methyltransferase [Spirochaetales bacterium]
MFEEKIAHLYDFLLFPFIHPIRKKLLSIADNYKYLKILDVCCGTGNQLKYLKSKGFDAIGIDLSDKMMSVAAKGAVPVKCFKENAEEMSFEPESFDMTTTTFALHEKTTESALAVLHEMLRVTKKGGHLILIDFNIDQSVPSLSRKACTFIESLAGGEHYENYKNYCNTGGIDSLINQINVKEIERHESDFEAVTIRILEKL